MPRQKLTYNFINPNKSEEQVVLLLSEIFAETTYAKIRNRQEEQFRQQHEYDNI